MSRSLELAIRQAGRQYADTGSVYAHARHPHYNTITAPVKGLNSRDAIDSTKMGYAIILDNWFATEGRVITRKGYTLHRTIPGVVGDGIQTLFHYQSGEISRLYAVANNKVWNVSTDPPTETTTVGAISDDRWHATNFAGGAVWTNGVDEPKQISPTSNQFVAHGLTRESKETNTLTTSKLISTFVFKGRLYWVQKDAPYFWFGGVGAAGGHIQGDLFSFNLGEVIPEGGNIQALGSMTFDSGEGPDDLFLAVLENGYIAVYKGYDPSNADNWSLAGVFRVPRAIGRQPLVKFGGDVLLITRGRYHLTHVVVPWKRLYRPWTDH